jgi:hypothetical protein
MPAIPIGTLMSRLAADRFGSRLLAIAGTQPLTLPGARQGEYGWYEVGLATLSSISRELLWHRSAVSAPRSTTSRPARISLGTLALSDVRTWGQPHFGGRQGQILQRAPLHLTRRSFRENW